MFGYLALYTGGKTTAGGCFGPKKRMLKVPNGPGTAGIGQEGPAGAWWKVQNGQETIGIGQEGGQTKLSPHAMVGQNGNTLKKIRPPTLSYFPLFSAHRSPIK
jgi:hypothetical protein